MGRDPGPRCARAPGSPQGHVLRSAYARRFVLARGASTAYLAQASQSPKESSPLKGGDFLAAVCSG